MSSAGELTAGDNVLQHEDGDHVLLVQTNVSADVLWALLSVIG